MDKKVRKQSIRFCDIIKQISGIYEGYAKSIGLSYTSLYALHLVYLTENCTQKYICEQLFLPKQTVNSIVTLFRRQGLVEMMELPEDRRHKAICLTAKGKEYAEQVLPNIDAAETRSIEQFDSTERMVLLRLMEKYAQTFSEELKK